MKICVLDSKTILQNDLSFDSLSSLGEVTIYERTNYDEIINRIKGYDIILTNKVVIDKEIIDHSSIKMIQVLATGYNNIDISYCHEKQITVCNIPSYSTSSVAQIVFSYILHFTNHIMIESKSVFNHEWENSLDFMYMKTTQTEIFGKTLGIIGFGKIGEAVKKIGEAFGMSTLIHSRTSKPGFINSSLEDVLTKSDFVTIHCPLTIETNGLVNASFLKKMKPSSFLINTSRGSVVNEDDLAYALNNHLISGAALDVLSTEPPLPNNPLLKAKNCLITPHLAWATKEARERLISICCKNIQGFIQNNPINVIKE